MQIQSALAEAEAEINEKSQMPPPKPDIVYTRKRKHITQLVSELSKKMV